MGDGVVQLSVSREPGHGEVGTSNDGGPGGRVQSGIADIHLGVHPVLDVGPDVDLARGDELGQGFDACLCGVHLGLGSSVSADVGYGLVDRLRFLAATLVVMETLGRFLGAVPFCYFLARGPVGPTDKDPHPAGPGGKQISDFGEPGEVEVPHGDVYAVGLAVGLVQDATEMFCELGVAVGVEDGHGEGLRPPSSVETSSSVSPYNS